MSDEITIIFPKSKKKKSQKKKPIVFDIESSSSKKSSSSHKKSQKKKPIVFDIESSSSKKSSSSHKKSQKKKPIVFDIESSSSKKTLSKKQLNTMEDTNIMVEIEPNKEIKVKKSTKKTIKITPKQIKNYLEEFKKQGIEMLETLSEKQLVQMVQESNDAYYNKNSLLNDNQFDIIKEFTEQKFPNNKEIKNIGAPVERNKVKLPYFMPSMDKIKPDTKALEKWEKKYSGPYVTSSKLDGISALYLYTDGKASLYTRGDGKVGQNISHLIDKIHLPKLSKEMAVRGELLISKQDFNDHFKDSFANARNLVAGLVNQKKPDYNKIKYLHFVAYEVINPELKPSEQLDFAKDNHFEVVRHITEEKVSNEFLSDLLVKWRTNYEYEIDGIIVTDDKIYTRKDKNPDHSFAFKMVLSDQVAEAKVVDVIWNPSKDGYLKPRVRIEPIKLGGVTIEYATGFNGAFIEKNKIGVGTIVELIRSGDVIPYIKSVIQESDQAKMPNILYKWNNTHVDIMLEDIKDNEVVKEKNITLFFKGISVDGLSSGIVKKIMKAGYTSIPEIISLKEEDLLKIEGFKKTLAHKIFTNIQSSLAKANVKDLMAASNIFGRGFSQKKIELIMEEYPDLLISNDSQEDLIKKVSKIKGMSKKTSEEFVREIPKFKEFMEQIGKSELAVILDDVDATTQDLKGKTIVFTGFRDKELEKNIQKRGGKIGSSLSKNTSLVLTKEIDDDSDKIKKAKELGVPIVLVSDFE